MPGIFWTGSQNRHLRPPQPAGDLHYSGWATGSTAFPSTARHARTCYIYGKAAVAMAKRIGPLKCFGK
jgi:hypothetical protein